MTLLALLTVLGTQFDHGNFNVSDKQSCQIAKAVKAVGGESAAYKMIEGKTFTHKTDGDDIYNAIENASCN